MIVLYAGQSPIALASYGGIANNSHNLIPAEKLL